MYMLINVLAGTKSVPVCCTIDQYNRLPDNVKCLYRLI